MSRTESREHAIQILFQIENEAHEISVEDATRFIVEPPNKDVFADELVSGVTSRQNELDEKISLHLKSWTLDRLNKIDRIILRLSTFELLYTDAPEKVIVNEAVNLAKKFSDDESYKFINGVLSEIIKNKA
ncbi:transcription antitermination factor NusB [Macrococcoides canis]|uniref:transcription antitermination factor NusB n=1 Tax=Macrococcoides canis TaxID=1855823 RepID=UPI0010FBC10F|nr:transcription antitermination factor NusB [Macrococcus canis]MCO4095536.1 transcription antitermination factor NusB [Macrococcus canis]QCT74958.1 transcription antitermination factor NusB [Macrococcus canis]UTH08256.1 transcription antitermination factor NusB [Macrococcus canis]